MAPITMFDLSQQDQRKMAFSVTNIDCTSPGRNSSKGRRPVYFMFFNGDEWEYLCHVDGKINWVGYSDLGEKKLNPIESWTNDPADAKLYVGWGDSGVKEDIERRCRVVMARGGLVGYRKGHRVRTVRFAMFLAAEISADELAKVDG